MITVDTNVLVYAYDATDPVKQATATHVVRRVVEQGGLIGLQVIGELQNVLKRRVNLLPAQAANEARIVLEMFAASFASTERAVEDALALMAAGRLSYWDALLVGSARDAGCRTLISEDMGDGQTWLSVEIVSPFAADGTPTERVRHLLPESS